MCQPVINNRPTTGFRVKKGNCMQEGTDRREAKAKPTLSQILEAARSLFMSQGYGETSMQDIPDRSGVSEGFFHHHFPSKQPCRTWSEPRRTIRRTPCRPGHAGTRQPREKVTGWLRQVPTSPDMTSLISSRCGRKGTVRIALHSPLDHGAPLRATCLDAANRSAKRRIQMPRPGPYDLGPSHPAGHLA